MQKRYTVEEGLPTDRPLLIQFIDRSGFTRTLGTRVRELTDDRLFLVVPDTSEAYKLRAGMDLLIILKDDSREGSYVAEVSVLNIQEGKVSLLVCSRPGRLHFRSRQFFRCDTLQEFSYVTEKSSGDGEIKNLSINGMFAVINRDEHVNPGQMLEITIPFSASEKPVCLRGRVLRVQRGPYPDKLNIGVAFKNALPNVQDEISKYLMARQRYLIRKGFLI